VSQSEQYSLLLEELKEGDISDEQLDALEFALDAMAFGQSLWDLFEDQCLHTPDADFSFDMMENIVDAINGELAAAVMFLTSLDLDVSKALNMNADVLEKLRIDTVSAEANVPDVIIKGNRFLADRVKNTKTILNARRITKMVPQA